jgi:hypothetical protein
MTPAIPLVAHYNRGDVREISLRVIAITPQNVMLVLWQNRLVPVHQGPEGLKLDRVEEFVAPTQVVRSIAPSQEPAVDKPKVGRPKKTETEETEG